MHLVLIIPFALLVLAAILAVVVISAIIEAIVFLAFALFQLVCCIGGGILLFLGSYRLIRTLFFGMYQRVYASAYVAWIGVGLILPSWGIASLTGSGFQQVVSRVTQERILFFWTKENMTF